MNEYKVVINIRYNGGFIPDFFGEDKIFFVKANSASEIEKNLYDELEELQFFGGSWKIKDIVKI